MSPTPRRSIPVDFIRKPEPGARVVIRATGGEFELHAWDGGLLAICTSAKRLSDWAFEWGAWEVRHDYDGKLSDNEH